MHLLHVYLPPCATVYNSMSVYDIGCKRKIEKKMYVVANDHPVLVARLKAQRGEVSCSQGSVAQS